MAGRREVQPCPLRQAATGFDMGGVRVYEDGDSGGWNFRGRITK
jgi:hypothetical protein